MSDFCQTIRKRKLGLRFWNNDVTIYLDAKRFQYTTQALDQARESSGHD